MAKYSQRNGIERKLVSRDDSGNPYEELDRQIGYVQQQKAQRDADRTAGGFSSKPVSNPYEELDRQIGYTPQGSTTQEVMQSAKRSTDAYKSQEPYTGHMQSTKLSTDAWKTGDTGSLDLTEEYLHMMGGQQSETAQPAAQTPARSGGSEEADAFVQNAYQAWLQQGGGQSQQQSQQDVERPRTPTGPNIAVPDSGTQGSGNFGTRSDGSGMTDEEARDLGYENEAQRRAYAKVRSQLAATEQTGRGHRAYSDQTRMAAEQAREQWLDLQEQARLARQYTTEDMMRDEGNGGMLVPMTGKERDAREREAQRLEAAAAQAFEYYRSVYYEAAAAEAERYTDLPQREDWDENRQAGQEDFDAWYQHITEQRQAYWDEHGFADSEVDYVTATANGEQGYGDRWTWKTPKDNWSEDQQELYYYLFRTDRDEAYRYALQTNYAIRLQERQSRLENFSEENLYGDDDGVLATIRNAFLDSASFDLGILGFLVSGFDYLQDVQDYINTGYSMPRTEISLSDITDTMTGATASHLNNEFGTLPEEWGPVGGKGLGDLFMLGQNTAESLLAVSLSGGSAGLVNLMFFGNAAKQTTENAIAQGMDHDQALTLGFFAGAAEVLGETISVDHLMSMDPNALMGVRDVIAHALVEAGEEGMTTLLNTYFNQLVLGDRNDINVRVEEMMLEGADFETAYRTAWTEWANDLAFDMVGGLVSGGFSSAIQGLSNNGEVRKQKARQRVWSDYETAARTDYYNGRRTGTETNDSVISLLQEIAADPERSQAFADEFGIDSAMRLGMDTANRADAQSEAETGEETSESFLNVLEDIAANPQQAAAFESYYGMSAQEAIDAIRSEEQAETEEEEESAFDEETEEGGRQVAAPTEETGTPTAQQAYLRSEMGQQAVVNRTMEENRALLENVDSSQRYALTVAAAQQEAGVALSRKLADLAQEHQDIMPQLRQAVRDTAETVAREQEKRGLKPAEQTRAKVQTQAKTQAKTETKTETKAETKTETKTAAKTEAKTGTEQKELTGRQQRNLQILQGVVGSDAAAVFRGMSESQKNGSSETVRNYASAFALIRNEFGARGAAEQAALKTSLRRGLSDVQVLQAYNMGRQQGESRQENRARARRGTGKVSLNGGELNGRTLKGVSDPVAVQRSRQFKAVQAFAQALHADVVMFESQADETGELLGEQGAYLDGVIYLDWNAGMNNTREIAKRMLMITISHELTHDLQWTAPSDYRALRDFVIDYLQETMGEKFNLQDLVSDTMAQQPDLSYEGAVNEIVANACEGCLANSRFARQLLRENQSLWEKICDWIQGFLDKIQVRSEEAKAMQPAIDRLQELWDKALKASMESRTETETDSKKAGPEVDLVQFSAREEVRKMDLPWDENEKSTIKMQEARVHDRLMQTDPVTKVRYDPKTDNYAVMLDKILRDRFGYKINRPDGISFLFDKEAIGTIRHYVGTDSEAAAAIAAPYVLKRGEIISGHKHHKGGLYPSLTFSAAVELNGEKGIESVAVLFADKDRVHALRIVGPDGKEFNLPVTKNETAPEMEGVGVEAPLTRPTGAASIDIVTDTGEKSNSKPQSSVMDSMGRTLSDEQAAYFADSKIRDESGNLKVMYRGGSGDFTVFDRKKSSYSNLYGRGFYFTESKEHAEQYGKAREFYLNITTPLQPGVKTFQKAQIRAFLEAVAENEDYGIENYGYGATVNSILKSLNGKDDFGVISDINATCIGDMVAAVELFNEVNGTAYDGIVTPTETVTFQSEQAKLTSNESPTENPDIRYSLRSNAKTDMELLQDVDGQTVMNERLQEEQKILQASLNETRRLLSRQDQTIAKLRRQLQITKSPQLRQADVKRMARSILQDYSSRADVDRIAGEMKELGEFILGTVLSGQAYNEELERRVNQIAKEVVENASEEAPGSEEYAEIVSNRLKGAKLSIDASFLGELGDFSAFRKSLFGKMTVAQRAANTKESRPGYMSVDQFYSELQDDYGQGYFPTVGNEGEQLLNIARIFELAQTQEYNPFRNEMRQAEESVQKRILLDLWSDALRLESPTAADRAKSRREALQKQIKQLQQQNRMSEQEAQRLVDTVYDLSMKLDRAQSQYRTALRENTEKRQALEQYRGIAQKYEQASRQVTRELDELDRLVQEGTDPEAVARQRAKVSAKEEQLGKALNRLTQAQKDSEIQKILQRERQIQRERTRSQIRESANRREIRQKIQKLWKDLNNRTLRGTEKKHIPPALMKQATEVLEALNMDTSREGSKSGERLRSRLLELRQRYTEIQNDTDFDRAAVYDPIVSKMLDRMIEEVGDTPINKMTAAQLETVLETLTALDHTARQALKVQLGEQEISAYEASMQMTRETRSVQKPKTGAVDTWINAQLSPERMFHRLGNYQKNSLWTQVYQMLDAGQLRQTQLQMEGSMIFEDLLANRDYKTMIDPKKTVDIGLKDEDGNPVLLTHGMMTALYMHLMNEQNTRHVAYGGLTVPALQDYYNGRKTRGSERAVRVGGVLQELAEINDRLRETEDAEEIAELEQQRDETALRAMDYVEGLRAAIEEKLTDYDRQWIAACRELFDNFSKRVLNKTTMEVYGIKKANVENYFPIWVDGDFLSTPFEAVAKDMSLENAGFMKERVDSSKPIRLADVSEVAASQIRKVAQYAGLMPAVRNFNKIWGKTQTGYRDSLRKAVHESFGQKGVNYIENLMADLNGARGNEWGSLGEFLNRMRGHMAQASLTLSLRTALGQTASYPTAASVVGWKALHKALWHGGRSNRLISRADQELIRKWSPLLYYRMKGYSTSELGDIAGMNDKFSRMWKKARWLTGWIQAMDGATVGRLWYAAEYYVQDHNKDLAKGTDAYYEAVAKKFNEIVELTQPNYTTMQRPDILRNPNALVKQLTMFLTQRLQNFNILYDAAATYSRYKADFKAGRNGVTAEDVRQAGIDTRRAAVSQIAAAATITLFKFLADGLQHALNPYRDDDDKELKAGSILLELLDMFMDALAGNLLGGGEVYDLIESKVFGKTYYGIEVSGVSTVTDLIDAASTTFDHIVKAVKDPDYEYGWEQIQGDLDKLARTFGTVAGIPYPNAKKIVNGVRWWIEDAVKGELFSFEAGVDRTNAQQATRLLRAYREMDYGKVNRILEDVPEDKRDDVYSAVRKLIKQEYEHGDVSFYEALRQLQKYGNASSSTLSDFIRDAYAAGEINRNEAVNQLVNYTGRERSRAESTVNNWAARNETGIAYTDLHETFSAGGMSEQQAREMLVNYGGKTAEEAERTVAYWSYQDNGGTLSQTRFETWRNDVAPTGVSMDYYQNALAQIDVNGNKAYSQGEAGPFLRAEEAANRLTHAQAAAIWDAITTGSTSYDQWLAKN